MSAGRTVPLRTVLGVTYLVLYFAALAWVGCAPTTSRPPESEVSGESMNPPPAAVVGEQHQEDGTI